MLDTGKVADSAVDLIVPTRSLTVSPEGEPEGDAAKVQQIMLGPSVLDTARFSTIHFGSTEVKGSQSAPGKWALTVAGEGQIRIGQFQGRDVGGTERDRRERRQVGLDARRVRELCGLVGADL